MVPVPSAAVPEAVRVQLLVGDVPPMLANVGLVPWFMTSSNGTFNAETSASPAVAFARA